MAKSTSFLEEEINILQKEIEEREIVKQHLTRLRIGALPGRSDLVDRAEALYGQNEQNPAPAPAQVSPIFSLEGLGSVEAIVKTITLHGKKGMKVRNIAEKMLAHGYKNREGRTPPIEELNPRVANMLLTRNDVFERVSYGIYKVS